MFGYTKNEPFQKGSQNEDNATKMKRYEKHLLIGTVLTFFGVYALYKFQIEKVFSWGVIIFGKLIILLSIMEYIDYRRAFRGEDLEQDGILTKTLRKLRKKYYSS